MRKVILGLVCVAIALSSFQCQNPDLEGDLRFRQGILDLREITFKENTSIELQGEWELYFGEFHYPPFHGQKELTGYLAIPNSWQNEEYGGIELPRTGKVTLRAFIHTNKQTVGQELRIYIPDIASSYRFLPMEFSLVAKENLVSINLMTLLESNRNTTLSSQTMK